MCAPTSTASSTWARPCCVPRTTRSGGTSARDPAGNEFCVFAPADDRPDGFYELVVDSADPQAQADWWADVLGGTQVPTRTHPWRWVEALPGAPFEYLVFNPVPEPKTVKNRWHWDVVCDDLDGLLAQRGDPAAGSGRRHRLARTGRPGGQRVLRLHVLVRCRA